MNDCKCCHSIQFWENADKELEKKQEVSSKLFAKICSYTWRKGQRRIRGNQISTVTSRAYNLNFCPSCGRKLGD